MGIPHIGSTVASHVARETGLRFIDFGSERDDVGELAGKLLDLPDKGAGVVLFDDVMASGRSLWEPTQCLRDLGVNVAGAYVVYDKLLSSEEHRKVLGVHVARYFEYNELMLYMRENEFKREDVEVLERRHEFLRSELADEVWTATSLMRASRGNQESASPEQHLPLDLLEFLSSGLLKDTDLSEQERGHLKACAQCSRSVAFYRGSVGVEH